MTSLLTGLLVLLIGSRLRVRPRARSTAQLQPIAPNASTADASLQHRSPPSPVAVRHRLRRRPATPSPEHVAAWCDGLARAIRGGASLTAALREVDPPPECSPRVESVRLALRRGASLHDACMARSGSSELDVAFTVIRACAAHGGPAAEPLSRTAATLRGRAADAAERRTNSAQARLSAIVMTVLPLGMLALLLLTSGSVRQFVVSPPGLGVAALGALLNAIGWLWMGRLIRGGGR